MNRKWIRLSTTQIAGIAVIFGVIAVAVVLLHKTPSSKEDRIDKLLYAALSEKDPRRPAIKLSKNTSSNVCAREVAPPYFRRDAEVLSCSLSVTNQDRRIVSVIVWVYTRDLALELTNEAEVVREDLDDLFVNKISRFHCSLLSCEPYDRFLMPCGGPGRLRLEFFCDALMIRESDADDAERYVGQCFGKVTVRIKYRVVGKDDPVYGNVVIPVKFIK